MCGGLPSSTLRRGHSGEGDSSPFAWAASYRGNSLADVALNDAVTTLPGCSSSRAADAAVISATSGPTRTRTRFPIGASEITGALLGFRREASGDAAPSETSHG